MSNPRIVQGFAGLLCGAILGAAFFGWVGALALASIGAVVGVAAAAGGMQ